MYVNGITAAVVGLNDYGSSAIVDWVIIILKNIADVAVAKRLRDLSGNPCALQTYTLSMGISAHDPYAWTTSPNCRRRIAPRWTASG